MKIIYYDSTGQYLAVIAAAIHLNMLTTKEEVPSWTEFSKLPYFNANYKVELGKIIFVGTDQSGNEIYILGSAKVGKVIERAVQGLNDIFEIKKESLFIDLTKNEDWLLSLGLIFKRVIPVLSLGNKLIYSSLANSFSKIVDEVDKN
jgi:hypothetical protein